MPAMSKSALAVLLASVAWAADNKTAPSNGGLCCYAGCAAKPSGCNAAGTWCSQSGNQCNQCHGTWCPDGPSPPPAPPTPPTPGAEWCPTANDLGFDYNQGGGKIYDGGWTVRGEARIHSKAAFNLLGGWVEFDLDTTGAHTGVNNNLYTISPKVGSEGYKEMGQYCDGAVTDRSRRSAVSNASVNSYWCMEMDIYEANGNCGSASTVHTVKGHGGGCDAGGCQVTTHFGSQSFKVHADFGADGTMAVSIGGIMQTPGQDEGSKAVVRSTMQSTGAVIQSSQWAGWVPVAECGTSGDKDSSIFKVSNLRIKGSVVAGPQPTRCAGSATVVV